MNNTSDKSLQGRLMSLDALRGLDMLFLVGIAGVFQALGRSYDNAFFDFLAGQCEHTIWHGFHLYDLIFPLFIFMVGVSMPFAISKRLQDGYSRKRLYIHIVKRSLILFFLGLIFNGSILGFNFSTFTFTGVLQRISIAYFFSALIVMNTNIKKQAIIAGSLLVLYWLIMTLVPVPGYGAGVITPEGNLHTYIDQLLLPGKMNNGFYDEDGILQQISSVAVCLAGVLAGHWLRSSYTQNKKVLGLLTVGIISILIALLWDLSFPIIFRLWSSSYAMLVIGISSILLSFFYWIIDVKGYRKWAFPFIIVGLNSITIYLVAELFDFGTIVNIFVHGFIDYLGPFKPVFWALCILAVEWLFLYFLLRRKYF
ncbi:MAG: acyltransferase family protein [Chitinophagaceae bacterium]